MRAKVKSMAKSKVFWTEAEKEAVVRRAMEIQRSRPDLSGLPLFREAMMALPVERRRKVAALTIAPWFEVGLKAEVKRIADEKKAREPLIQMAKTRNQLLDESNRLMSGWREDEAAWKKKALALHDQTVTLLLQLLTEVRALNANVAEALSTNKSSANGEESRSTKRR